jgi:hypothetical protein
MSDNWIALPLTPGEQLRVFPNDAEMTGSESVAGMIYNPATSVLIAITTTGESRWITVGDRRFHLVTHLPEGFR